MNPTAEERKNKDDKETSVKKEPIDKRFEKETNRQINQLNDKFIPELINSINYYTVTQGYKEINPILRNTKSDHPLEIKSEAEEIRKKDWWNTRNWDINRAIGHIEVLDKAFKNFKTVEDVTVYRRAGAAALGFPPSDKADPISHALNKFDQPENKEWIEKNVIEKWQKKGIFSERGYLSTSFEQNYHHSSWSNNPVHFEIFVPKDTRAITVTSQFGRFENEKELLLDRGYTIEITKKEIKATKIEGKWVIFIKGRIRDNN